MNSRHSYTASQKLSMVEHAELKGNRAASREFSVPESNIRLWRKNKEVLQTYPSRKRANRGVKDRYNSPDLQEELIKWMAEREVQVLKSVFKRKRALCVIEKTLVGFTRVV